MHKLGFVSAILADNTFEEVVDFASDNQFACVEMMCWPKGKAERRYAGVTHVDADNLGDAEVAHIKSYLKKKNVFISGLGYYPNPLDPDPEQGDYYLAHIKKVIEAAAKLDIPVVNTFVGRHPSKSVEENLEIFAEKWPPIVAFASAHNIKIGIENCPMLFSRDEWPGGKNLATTPEIWDRMFEIIPDPNFGLNYDPSHPIWLHMDEIQPIYDYAHRFHHVHLKDVRVDREKLNRVGIMAYPNDWHTPKLPGFGDVRWGKFFAALSEKGYRGPVCIEVEDRAFEGSEEDVKTSILISRNYLSQFVTVNS
ncbi:MAG: sugar phosphate isomerase/epimerase [Cyclobacteriaceae bacterium]|nr:sugar phosphate isomerase/epimerase [Cyclobacteriaceae bacterium]